VLECICYGCIMIAHGAGVRVLHSARLTGKLLTLGQIRHATIKTNDYYPFIARAVERLDRSTGEARRAVYERARKAVAELRSNQLALLDAEITEERLALEEAIRKVEAEAVRKSPTETQTEPQPAPSEGMPDGDNIQSRDHGQRASPDRDDRPPALLSRQAPIFLPTASDDRNNTDIQAVAIGGAYGADHYHDDVPCSRWPGSPLVQTAVLALAVLAGTFAYRAMFGGSVFPALPPIIKAGTGPNNIVRSNSDTRWSNSSQTSATSAGPSEKLQPMDIREAPKAVPRVISTIPISSKPSAAAVVPLAPASAATAPALDPPIASALDQHVPPSVPPPASAPVPVPASSEPTETAAVAPVAREPGAPLPALAPPLLTAASVPPPASAPSEPTEIHRDIVAPDGWGETDTPSPPALADTQGDAVLSPSSRSPMQARSGTALVSFGGAYAVQVVSQRSAAEARASFRALRAKFPNQLGGLEPIVRRTDLGVKGIYYRAMVGPFASMEKAAGMCRTLKAAGCNCLVQRN
jgi:SPOR domain